MRVFPRDHDGNGVPRELAGAQCAERFGETLLRAEEEMNLVRHASAEFESNAHRIAYDAVGAPTFVCEFPGEWVVAQDRWPETCFHKMREHGGLVFHSDMAAGVEDSTIGVSL